MVFTVRLVSIALTLCLATPILATPLPNPQASNAPAAPDPGRKRAVGGVLNFLCNLPFLSQSSFCLFLNLASANPSVRTPLGPARGVNATATPNVVRFAVKYANANRWRASTLASTWQLPNGSNDPSALPLACPQPPSAENSQPTSEDCLSMILYVPVSLTGNLPTLMWIHGGSFVVGSATGPGLDGSALAAATNSIVAVIQYRLGALGFVAPSGEANLAVKDVINALQFLKRVVPSFGGDTSKITIAGQSSGATMVRALLATPSANSLFRSAILQSDPMDYGFLNPGAQQTLVNFFNGLLPCTSTDTACLNSISVDNIINFELQLMGQAPSLDPSTGAFEPMRPVRDGALITTSLTSSTPFPTVRKNVLITTVKDEAGPAIYALNPDIIPEDAFPILVNITFGEPRTTQILTSARYAAAAGDARPQLEALGTDYMWRCPSWTFARAWAANAAGGAKAYVGEYSLGALYPSNEGVAFCEPGTGHVCHEDDIQIVFGTVPSPTSAQSALSQEIQARYAAFLNGGNPNRQGLRNWAPVAGSDTKAINLGGSGLAPVDACDPAFWGQAILYDYQVFGI